MSESKPRRIELTVLGKPPRKSNSRRIVVNRRTGKPMLIKSKDALQYTRDFAKQVPECLKLGLGSKEIPIAVMGAIYYPWWWRGDLSGELILDCLEATGVLSDDRYVVRQTWLKRCDKERPRCDLVVEELEDWAMLVRSYTEDGPFPVYDHSFAPP